jgi:hypothetical protein
LLDPEFQKSPGMVGCSHSFQLVDLYVKWTRAGIGSVVERAKLVKIVDMFL